MVFLLEPNRLELRVAGGGRAAAGRGGRHARPQPTRHLARLRAARKAAPVIVADYAAERRFTVPRRYLEAGLTSALAVPLSDRGRTIGVARRSARASAQRFGDDEVRFLESLANLLADAACSARSRRRRSTTRSGSRASAS